MKSKDYPKDRYSAYFEVVRDESGQWTARVYAYDGTVLAEKRGSGSPDAFLKAEMAKHTRSN